MKIQNTISLLVLTLFFSITAWSQKPCCAHGSSKKCAGAESSKAFASLGSDAEFREAHAEPEAATQDERIGKMKLIDVEGGEMARIYEALTAYKTNKYLLVFHEWWGLNAHIQNETDRWFKSLKDVNVIAVDLYDGKWTRDREKAQQLMQNNDPERSLAIIRATLDYIGKNASVATIGWCFGGGWSLQAAIEAGKNGAACVMYYGMPEEDTERLQKLEAPVLGIFAKKDDWINEEVVSKFEQKMEKLNKPLTVKWYDAVHAFANPSNPNYDEKAAEDARDIALQFLAKQYYLRE